MIGMYSTILESIYGASIKKEPGNEAARSAIATEFWRRKKIFKNTLEGRQISDDHRSQFRDGLVAHITKDKPGRQITRSELNKAGEVRNDLKSGLLNKSDNKTNSSTDITNIQPETTGSLMNNYKNHRMTGLYNQAKNNNKGSLLNTVV
ncbi:MAG: hypothetical protein WC136_01195 [Sphaerochaeta sp.]|jgi:hypothetical protein